MKATAKKAKAAPPVEAKATVTMTELAELAESQRKLAHEVEKQEKSLSEAKAKLRKVQEDLLPTAMENAGVEEFKLKDGSKVTIKKTIACSIAGERAPAAFTWLSEHGHTGIIRSSIFTEFELGDTKTRDKAVAALAKLKLEPEMEMKVHPQTLKAFITELLERGEDIPFDTFGIVELKKSILKEKSSGK